MNIYKDFNSEDYKDQSREDLERSVWIFEMLYNQQLLAKLELQRILLSERRAVLVSMPGLIPTDPEHEVKIVDVLDAEIQRLTNL